MERLSIDVGSCGLPLAGCGSLVQAEYGPGSYYHSPPTPLSVVRLAGWRPSRLAFRRERAATDAGFTFAPRISRGDWEADMNALRASAQKRQGRRMPAEYLEAQSYGRDRQPDCPRHGYYVHGVLSPAGRLVSYVQVYQCGDAARINSLLTHADHLEDGCMWLAVKRALELHAAEMGAEWGIYYAHSSGTPGLAFFKERLGFGPATVRWQT